MSARPFFFFCSCVVVSADNVLNRSLGELLHYVVGLRISKKKQTNKNTQIFTRRLRSAFAKPICKETSSCVHLYRGTSFFSLYFFVCLLLTAFVLLLSQEMLKCNKGERMAELEEALATVLDIIKSVNDSMHQIAITGFEVSHSLRQIRQRTLLALLRLHCGCLKEKERKDRSLLSGSHLQWNKEHLTNQSPSTRGQGRSVC